MASNYPEPTLEQINNFVQREQDMRIMMAEVVRIQENVQLDAPEASRQTWDSMRRFLDRYPRIDELLQEHFLAEAHKRHADSSEAMKLLKAMIGYLFSKKEGRAYQQLPTKVPALESDTDTQNTNHEVLQRDLHEQLLDQDQLSAVLGATDNLSCDVQQVGENLSMTWPFDVTHFQSICAEWLQCNDYVPQSRHGKFREMDAPRFWLLSITNQDMLDHGILADWIMSAKDHLQNLQCLGFLYTALQNLAAKSRLSSSQTWVAVRLLEFFVMLDKAWYRTELSAILLRIQRKADTAHPIPLVICLWIKNQLFKHPLTRGQCLAIHFMTYTETVNLGDGIKAFQIAGAPDVFITDPADKIFKCSLDDVSLGYTKEYDFIVKFKGYARHAVVCVTDIRQIEKAFPDLDLASRNN